MRNTLPNKINELECGIVNLDINKNKGTHCVCYYKNKSKCYNFDLFTLDLPIFYCFYLI